MQFDALLVALLGKFLYDIAPEWGCINNVVVALLRVPHRETVMVTAGEADVLCSGILYCRHPCFGIKTVWVERICSLCIFRLVDGEVL